MFQKIAAADPQHLLIGVPGSHISHAEFSSSILVSVLGFCMWPSMFMRAYNLDSPRTLRRTIVLYPTFALFLVPVLLIGFAGIPFVDLHAQGLQDDAILPYAPMIRRELTPHEMMRLVRLAVLVFGAIAYLIAIYGGASLVRLLLGAYGSIVQIFPIAIAAVYWKRATAAGVLAGFIAGVALNFLISFKIVPAAWTLDLHAGLWGLG